MKIVSEGIELEKPSLTSTILLKDPIRDHVFPKLMCRQDAPDLVFLMTGRPSPYDDSVVSGVVVHTATPRPGITMHPVGYWCKEWLLDIMVDFNNTIVLENTGPREGPRLAKDMYGNILLVDGEGHGAVVIDPGPDFKVGYRWAVLPVLAHKVKPFIGKVTLSNN